MAKPCTCGRSDTGWCQGLHNKPDWKPEEEEQCTIQIHFVVDVEKMTVVLYILEQMVYGQVFQINCIRYVTTVVMHIYLKKARKHNALQNCKR